MSHKRERDLEREQIKWVFGLTGGELADKPWEFEEFHETLKHDANYNFRTAREPRAGAFRYWYDGVPDYAEIRDKYSETYRTVVVDELFGAAPSAIRDGQGIWKKVRSFRSSGETECPGRQDEGDVTKDSASNGEYCDYCEANIGEEHGYIYLGDGWGEVIYQLHKSRYLEDEEAPRRESHQRTALTKRSRTLPMQEHGKPVDFAKRRRAVSGYTIEERGAQWQRREPGGKYYIRPAYGEDRIIEGDYKIHSQVPGKYETEAEAEAVARSLFPNAKRVRY